MNPTTHYQHYLQQQQQRQLYRTWHTYAPLSATSVRDANGHVLHQFASNNYLGLSHHAQLQQAAIAATQQYGIGTPASRAICGQTPLLTDTEQKLAEFLGYAQAIIFPAGYQMCASVVAALADAEILRENAVLCADKACHASLYAGARMAQATLRRYAHQQAAGAIKHLPHSHLWITEGVFSMDGDTLIDNDFWQHTATVAQQHNVLTIVDDAHGFGVCGTAGRGTLADSPLKPQVLLGTFSKALGCMGGFVACDAQIADYLRQKCAGLIYTTVLSPAVLGAVSAAIDLLPHLDAERQCLQRYAAQLRAAIGQRGDSVGTSSSHIVTWHMPSIDKALAMQQMLYTQGFLVGCIRPPTVRTPLLRLCPSSAHAADTVDMLCQLIVQL